MATQTHHDDDVESSRAPLIEHLIELRQRLLWSVLAIGVAFVVCFYFATDIYNILVYPYAAAAGVEIGELTLIQTSPQEWFLTQIKLALFGAIFCAFPILATQIYMFIAPGLYRNERNAFLPYIIATPVLFLTGAALVYFVALPLAMGFFLSIQPTGDDQIRVILTAKVSEYLGLIMMFILAFGFCFQLPVVLTLLARAGFLTAQDLKAGRKYAIIAILAVAALLTPPDIVSQIGLGVPTYLLYELSILAVASVEQRRAREEEADEASGA